MKILIYGSTYIAARCASFLRAMTTHEIVGYVPCCGRPTIPGQMRCLPVKDEADVEHDFRLSIQFDRKIDHCGTPAYNLHTGLLPDWGGSDILYHTLRLGATQQGLTFHEITDRLDCGYIVSKITYPVWANDTMVDLYERVARLAPPFLASGLFLVEHLNMPRMGEAPERPTMYRRGTVAPWDQEVYAETPRLICERMGIPWEAR